MAPKVKAKVMDGRDMDRAITRIAHEILERNKGVEDVVLIGIRSRGEVVAERLAAKIKDIEGTAIPAGALDISFYRDDAGVHQLAKAPEGKDKGMIDLGTLGGLFSQALAINDPPPGQVVGWSVG